MSAYFEFFLYHLFYFFVGFIMIFLVLPFRTYRILFSNMQFSSCNILMYTQAIYWINNIMVFFCATLVTNPATNLTSLIISSVAVFTRASNIASKYSTFSKTQIKLYKEQYITVAQLRDDFLLGNWRVQVLDTIQLETQNAIIRNGFDESVFEISFLDEIGESTEKDRQELEKALELGSSTKKEVELRSGHSRAYYKGVMIFYLLVKTYNSKYSKAGFHLRMLLTITVLWCLTPIYAKFFVGGKMYNPHNILDSIVFYLNILISWILFTLTNMFFMVAKIDIYRAVFILQQMSHLLSTEKKSGEVDKVLPTMNFLEEVSLNSWKMLRRLAIDYGKKYFFRHQMYLPVVFVLGTVCFFLIIILQIQHDSFPKYSPGDRYLLEVQIAFGSVAAVFFFMTFNLLFGFARINEFFELHTLKLFHIRQILLDLLKYNRYYFPRPDPPGAPSHSGFDSNQVFDASSSRMHLALAKEIRLTLGGDLDAKIEPFIKRSIESVDAIIKELSIDQQYQSIEIVGFTISKEFTFNLMILLITVAVSFVDAFM